MADNWTKMCLTGAGSFRFSMGFLRDVLQAKNMYPVELVLHDINAPVLRDITRVCRRWIKKNNMDGVIKVSSTANREEAYQNVDYHLIVIAIGGQTSELSDIFTTLRMLKMPYNTGDTCGVPGVMRACREVPHIVAISQDIEKYSKCRIALNYSNPMAYLSWASQKYAPRANLVGICHELWGGLGALGEVFDKQYDISNMVEAVYPEVDGVQQMDQARVKIKYGGLNHYSWIYDMTIDGEYVLSNIDCNAWMEKSGGDRQVNYFLLKKYGGFATGGARHNVEFMAREDIPEYWDPLIECATANPEEDDFRRACPTGPFKIMPLRKVRDMHTDHVNSILQMRLQGLGLFPLPELGGAGEKALSIFQNDHTGNEYHTVGNLANLRPDGTKMVPNMPEKTALETDWWTSAGEIVPAPWGAMPDAIAQLVSKNANNVDNVVEAALSCDRNKLVQAIIGEPSCYHLAEADVAQCVDVLLAEQRGWLPEGWYR